MLLYHFVVLQNDHFNKNNFIVVVLIHNRKLYCSLDIMTYLEHDIYFAIYYIFKTYPRNRNSHFDFQESNLQFILEDNASISFLLFHKI